MAEGVPWEAGHERLLARLVARHGRRAVLARAEAIPPARRGRPARAPEGAVMGEGSEEPWKLLARLVAKYGRASVVARAKTIPPARRGPKPDLDMRAARDRDLEWIEERELTEKQRGRPDALKAATLDRFVGTTPKAKQTEPEARKYRKRVKEERREMRTARRKLAEERAVSPAYQRLRRSPK